MNHGIYYGRQETAGLYPIDVSFFLQGVRSTR